MNPFEIIPAIDLLDGKVVRLTQGDYAQVQTYADLTPADWAKKFEDAGAKRIHIVDLNGAKEGKLINQAAITAIRNAVSCKLEIGGGIRSSRTVKELLELGLDWIILGSLLIKDLQTAKDIIHAYPLRIIAGIDAHGTDVAIEGWLESSHTTIFDLIDTLKSWPIDSIIYTDISKDGTLAGPNLDSLKTVAAHSPIPVIASGGVGDVSHINTIRTQSHLGIVGVIVGKALLSGKINISELF